MEYRNEELKAVRSTFVIVVAALLVCTIALCQFTTRTTCVDVHTGRGREIIHIAMIPIFGRGFETPYSKAWLSCFGPYPSPEWETESQYHWRWGRHSPSYGYLGVFRWQDRMLSALNYAQFDAAARCVVISNFNAHLKRKDPRAAELYSLGLLAYAMEHQGQRIEGTNCPTWLKHGVFTGNEL
jgi:hypothetical protein